MLFEYINDFLYSVIKSDSTGSGTSFVYCSGVNISRFVPLTRGKHGQASNPAFRGLQLTNHEITAMVRDKGAVVKIIKSKDCSGLAPTLDTWSTESMVLENIPLSLVEQLVSVSVTTLLKKILSVCLPKIKLPGELPSPDELQSFLQSLCEKYGSQKKTGPNHGLGILKKNFIRYGPDDCYHVACGHCLSDNITTSGSESHTCRSCGQEIAVHRYPLAITPIRGNQVTSAVIKDEIGMRVVCGGCGLIIYVKFEGEESVNCVDCGTDIVYNSYIM